MSTKQTPTPRDLNDTVGNILADHYKSYKNSVKLMQDASGDIYEIDQIK